jgi:hypothetical protein
MCPRDASLGNNGVWRTSWDNLSLLACLLISSVLLSGCSTRVNVIEQSIGGESLTPAAKAQGPRPIAFVSQAELKSGGIQRPLGDLFLRQLQYKLRESELFSDVTFQKPWVKPITIKLSVEEFHDRHVGTNLPKAILSGLSLFLLSPALPIYEEYTIDVGAEVTSPEGQIKLYRANAKSEMYCNVMETQNALRDMYAKSLNRALNSLVFQMMTDQTLLTPTKAEPRTLHTGSRVHYGIWADNSKWTRMESSQPKDMSFRHVKGDAFASVLAERIQIPLETMKKLIVKNAESGIADLVVTESTTQQVNGREILHLRMHGNSDGIPFEYMIYVISGEFGTIQLFTYTGANLIAEYEKDFLEFLNGFVIDPT